MLDACPLPVLCSMLPITGPVRVTLLITAIEQEIVRNNGNAQSAVDAPDIYSFACPDYTWRELTSTCNKDHTEEQNTHSRNDKKKQTKQQRKKTTENKFAVRNSYFRQRR